MEETLVVSDRGHVRTLTMNRPERLNAISADLGWGLVHAIEDAARDDNVWVIAVTGEGRAFCAGVDLIGGPRPASATPLTDYLSDDGGWVSGIPMTMRSRCDKPIVGAINGIAVGGGLGIAMACDIRLMSSQATFMGGYAKIAACPDVGLSWTLQQMIGYERAMRFFLENRRVGADEALDLGLVSEVVPHDQLAARTREYCEQLCEWSPVTLRLTKRVVAKAAQDIDLEAQFRLEVASVTRGLSSEDGREARAAFAEKRTPVYKGL